MQFDFVDPRLYAPRMTPRNLKPGTVAPWDLYAAASLDALSSVGGYEPASAAELAAKIADAMAEQRAQREEGYQRIPTQAETRAADPPPAQGFVGSPDVPTEPGTDA